LVYFLGAKDHTLGLYFVANLWINEVIWPNTIW
jgi:hypothetical protein